ncbi:amino acid ABC transporter permease [Sporomusa termitida]|uniref:L-cystine transport system permease protein YecS n=1 Tax=Sporomusa termitida TaxID=2377 RepID=A0A517DZ79_9FIRM|nr:amino acid ABC transporter permease [Sporomusa termitida]QDR82653.1 L-cystine transport system permease protein YecS [Sporomusa termitida]
MLLVIDSLPILAQAAVITVFLAIVSMVIGLIIGLFVALARISKNQLLRRVAVAYVSIIRGTPLLVQIYVVYYGLPQIGVSLEPIPSGILALSINAGAYLSESFRAAIESVDKGQMEASLSIGMTYPQALRRIILPQCLRTALPTVGNTFIGLLKDTSLVSVITVTELLQSATLLIARTFQPLILYLEVGFIYWVLSTGFSIIQDRIELQATRHVRK